MSDPALHPSLFQSLFVTGTDTGVGKTTVTVALLRMLAGAGRRVAGMKPVAAGAELTSHGWRNDDALDLAAAGNVPVPYAWTNPVCLPHATSPHLAALDAGVEIELAGIKSAFESITARSELVMVEGAGGWLAPISARENGNRGQTMQDVAASLGLPVLMVVGVRLGCLNHALLTEAAIARSGLPLVGWIANPVDPHFCDADRYVASLQQELAAPLLWRAPRVILPGQ
jgi:dethiobiotin synthetase